MFTGIIEAIGEVQQITKEGSNVHIKLNAPFSNELKIDQSVAHNGCCLTVVELNGDEYTVTAIEETLEKTNLKEWENGTLVNLERCVPLGGRLDGHIVQGHIDLTGKVKSIEDLEGSYIVTIAYESPKFQTVAQGSVTVNGISLTVAQSGDNEFAVAIIPYTWKHTNMHTLKVGDRVNIEFDIIGKYVAKLMSVGNVAE